MIWLFKNRHLLAGALSNRRQMSTRHPKGRTGGRTSRRIEWTHRGRPTLHFYTTIFSSAVPVRRHAFAALLAVQVKQCGPFLGSLNRIDFWALFLHYIFAVTDSWSCFKQDKHCTLYTFWHFSRCPFQCQDLLSGITSDDLNEGMQMAALSHTELYLLLSKFFRVLLLL